jgi:hypothetical protein
MHEPVASTLTAWESFYIIVGSAAGALTGLQFVVMTLIGETADPSSRNETISAFGSPNVVHFCAGLLVASILSVPWTGMIAAGIAVALCGVLGVVYSAIVLSRALRQNAYVPVFEDWIFHTILPTLAYLGLLVAGIMLAPASAAALLIIGAALLLLVFIGIHNAWDTVTYVTMARGTQGRTIAAAAGEGAAQASGPRSELIAGASANPAAATKES